MEISKKLKKVNLSEIKPYKNNPKTHSQEQINVIKNSILRNEYIQPICVDKNNEIVIGHGRYEAMKEINPEAVIEVVDLSHLPPKKIKKLRILDNRTHDMGEWDNTLLDKEIINLFDGVNIEAISVDEIGFNSDYIEEVFNKQRGEEKEDVEDEVPEMPECLAIKEGDIIELGKHRLMCGDSTDREQVDRLMDGNKADMVFTDPPYGMNAVKNSGVLKEKGYKDVIGDDTNETARKAFLLCKSIKNKIFWGANYYPDVLPSSGCWIVWDKNNGQSDQADAELAWTNFKGVVRKYTQASEKTNRVHPTQKPVSLIEWAFARWLKGNINILDLFLGSGSTLIACEKTSRICYGMELDRHYCSVIIERYCNYTGASKVKINGQEVDWNKYKNNK